MDTWVILLIVGVLFLLFANCDIEFLNPYVKENKYLTKLNMEKNPTKIKASVSRLQFENLKRKTRSDNEELFKASKFANRNELISNSISRVGFDDRREMLKRKIDANELVNFDKWKYLNNEATISRFQ